MKIGLVASIWIQVPPPNFGFGAQEYLIYHLAENLIKKGHDVTLFASGDSQTQAKLVSVTDKQVKDLPSEDNKIKDFFELMNLSEAYKRAGEFDIIHNHLLPYGLFFSQFAKTPTVHTLHHQIYTKRGEMYAYLRHKDQRFITISNAQRAIVPELNYVATVYNGVDPNFFSFSPTSEDYLLYFGRIKRYKGIHTAVQVAKKLGLPLKIAGPLPQVTQPDYKEVQPYWDEEIKPHLGGNIEYVGTVEGEKKLLLIQKAKALLFPIEREEPFGMTLIEAMSCGTPVLAYARGAAPEIVHDGKTGFLVNFSPDDTRGTLLTQNTGIDGLTEATKQLMGLSETEYATFRENSRKHVEENFTIATMVDNYEAVYQQILAS